MNDWITHVKCYQATHNCSYKDAMSGAKSTYKKGSVEGGKFNLAKAVKKVTKGAKRGSKLVQQNKELIKMVAGDKYSDKIDKVNRQMGKAVQIADAVESQTGAGIGKHFGRKLNHSVHKASKIANKVSKNIDKYAPMLEIVAPELMPVIAANNALRGGELGSTRNGRVNPYLAGSFAVPGHHGGSFAVPHGGSYVPTNSSLISVHHPAFHPKKPKSYRELIVNN
jgi:hypothetical protein